jgi:hypothetical protein
LPPLPQEARGIGAEAFWVDDRIPLTMDADSQKSR